MVYRLRLKNKFKSFGFAVKYRLPYQTDIYRGYVHRVNNERDEKKKSKLPSFLCIFFFFQLSPSIRDLKRDEERTRAIKINLEGGGKAGNFKQTITIPFSIRKIFKDLQAKRTKEG